MAGWSQSGLLCECGCGGAAPIATTTRTGRGQVKGRPVRFIRGHNASRPLAARLWAKVDRREPDECWPWTGKLDEKGYGRLWVGTRAAPGYVRVHRAVYELEVGPIPDGHDVHHTCVYKPCCNPRHLEAHLPVDHPDSASTLNRAKTHCPQGHPYDEANTYWAPGGGRQCRGCGRARDLRRAGRPRVMAHGGLADGALVVRATTLRYFDVDGGGHASPGPGRALYRLAGEHYQYEPLPCDGCGGLIQPDGRAGPDECPVCGHER